VTRPEIEKIEVESKNLSKTQKLVEEILYERPNGKFQRNENKMIKVYGRES
jgi:hypothetical protein